MQVIWASEHSEALREYLAKGMSFAKIADAINAKFKTSYTRNATLGRATRMGLAGPGRTEEVPKHPPAPQPEKRPPEKAEASSPSGSTRSAGRRCNRWRGAEDVRAPRWPAA